MAGARTELIRRLREAIGAWEVPPVHASLFGSAARGDGDASSDIDLLVVRPAEVDPDDAQWRGQVDGLADLVRRWTGNNAGIAEVAEGELARLRRDRPPVVEVSFQPLLPGALRGLPGIPSFRGGIGRCASPYLSTG